MAEPPAKKSRVHFGSLEEQEKIRLSETGNVSSAVLAGIKAGNINIDAGWCALLRVSTFGTQFGHVQIKYWTPERIRAING